MNEARQVTFLISVYILGTTSNLLQPEYSIKIVNTENIILSLGDLDEKNDDLELIKASPDPVLQKKLHLFHKYVNLLKTERKAKAKNIYHKPVHLITEFGTSNEPIDMRVDRPRWRMWGRRPDKKRKSKKKLRTSFSKHFKFKKYIKRKADIVKRQMSTPSETGTTTKEELDSLEKDYWDFVNKSLADKTAFKYTEEGKPEESVKDVIRKITDLKTPKNCSAVKSVGVQAVECVVKNFKEKEIDKKEMMKRMSIISFVWIGIYMAFAIPLWCTRGWCCCCFRCEFCLPVTTVRRIQKYMAQNPPGVYIDENGEEKHYTPTEKETELYEKLTRTIAEF